MAGIPENLTPPPAVFVGSEFSEKDYERIRKLLSDHLGFDLGRYKDRCIKRRIASRVRALGFSEPTPYIELLFRDVQERRVLLDTLTIHVSQFFRNPSTFAFLETHVLPRLLAQKPGEPGSSVRLWSAGCAGGEEPYSLSLLLDSLDTRGREVTILGTDVSDVALERAREALFEAGRLAEVAPEVLQGGFERHGERYRLKEALKKRVEFRCQDILGDAPYPESDLILCRNVLIYFSRSEQRKILERFAEALSPGGFLVLGKAETLLGEPRSLFKVECPVERVYRKV